MMWRGKYSGFNNLYVFNEHRYVYVTFGIVVFNLRKFCALDLQRCSPLCTYWLFLCQRMKNMLNEYTVFTHKIPHLIVKEFLKFAFNCSPSFLQLLNFVKLCQMTWWNVMLTSISKWQISWNKWISFVKSWKQTAYTEIAFEAQEKATKGLQNLDTKTSELCRKIKLFITTLKWQIFRL